MARASSPASEPQSSVLAAWVGQPHPDVDVMYATDALHTALTGADHVVICAPLTRATWHLIDACAIAAMKPGATLVNIGRGGVVDEQALASALISGHISCALLDVFEQEPLPPQAPAWTLPNTVITPHCSSDDAVDYVPRTLDLIFANLDKMVAGQELLARVDPVLEY